MTSVGVADGEGNWKLARRHRPSERSVAHTHGAILPACCGERSTHHFPLAEEFYTWPTQ
jgi:hypothetical protein